VIVAAIQSLRRDKPAAGTSGAGEGAACEGSAAGSFRELPLLPDFRRLRTNAQPFSAAIAEMRSAIP